MLAFCDFFPRAPFRARPRSSAAPSASFVSGSLTRCAPFRPPRAQITKNTQSSSNATATFEWYVRYLDAYCQSLEDCKIGCSECGWALRAALPGGNDTDYSCFGLHSVDSSARPQGPVPFDDMVRLFEQGMANFTQVTPLLDQSTMLYADNADTYLERFAVDGVPHLVGEWYSESGLHMYSIVAHVPSTIGNLEIVTRQISDSRMREAAMRLDHARLPDSAFAIAGVNLSAPFSPSHLKAGFLELDGSCDASDVFSIRLSELRMFAMSYSRLTFVLSWEESGVPPRSFFAASSRETHTAAGRCCCWPSP